MKIERASPISGFVRCREVLGLTGASLCAGEHCCTLSGLEPQYVLTGIMPEDSLITVMLKEAPALRSLLQVHNVSLRNEISTLLKQDFVVSKLWHSAESLQLGALRYTPRRPEDCARLLEAAPHLWRTASGFVGAALREVAADNGRLTCALGEIASAAHRSLFAEELHPLDPVLVNGEPRIAFDVLRQGSSPPTDPWRVVMLLKAPGITLDDVKGLVRGAHADYVVQNYLVYVFEHEPAT